MRKFTRYSYVVSNPGVIQALRHHSLNRAHNIKGLDENKWANFVYGIQEQYNKNNPLTNSIHSLDTLQAVYWMVLGPGKMAEKYQLTDMQVLACLLSAIIHDVDHPGVNNIFLESIFSPLAIDFSNDSILERHHLATAFRLAAIPENNIFSDLPVSTFCELRKLVISIVLATDSKQLFQLRSCAEAIIEHGLPDYENNICISTVHQEFLCQFVVHFASCSSLAIRRPAVSQKFAFCSIEENYRQGDLEREQGMKLSPFADRQCSDAEGYLKVYTKEIVSPLVNLMSTILSEEAADLMFIDYKKAFHALHNGAKVPLDSISNVVRLPPALEARERIQALRSLGRTHSEAGQSDAVEWMLVHVRVHEVQNLIEMDSNGRCDPFVVLSVEANHPMWRLNVGKMADKVLCQQYQTSVQFETLQAVYNEDFSFVLGGDVEMLSLKFTAMDHDLVGDEFIGSVRIGLADLFADKESDASPCSWYYFRNKSASTAGGAVLLSFRLLRSMPPRWAEAYLTSSCEESDENTNKLWRQTSKVIKRSTSALKRMSRASFLKQIPGRQLVRQGTKLTHGLLKQSTSAIQRMGSFVDGDDPYEGSQKMDTDLDPYLKRRSALLDVVSSNPKLGWDGASARSIRLFVGTWNVGEAKPPPSEVLKQWLLPGSHLYAVGTQENTTGSWSETLLDHLNTEAYTSCFADAGKGSAQATYLLVARENIFYVKGDKRVDTRLDVFALKSICKVDFSLRLRCFAWRSLFI